MLNPFEPCDPFQTFPSELINGLQARQEVNHNKFASSKIFREEFFKFANTSLLWKYNYDLDKIRQRANQDFKNELDKIYSQHKDTWYVVQDLVRAVARLTEEIQAQKPIIVNKKLVSKSKKKK